MRKGNKLPDGGWRQIGIIFVNFFQRRTQLGVLNDGVRENARAPHDGAARYLAGYPFHQVAAGPVDIRIGGFIYYVCASIIIAAIFIATGRRPWVSVCSRGNNVKLYY